MTTCPRDQSFYFFLHACNYIHIALWETATAGIWRAVEIYTFGLLFKKKKPTSLGFPRHILFSIISPEKNTEKWTFTLDFQTSNSSDGITFAYQETPEKFSMHLSGSCVDLLHFGFQPNILCGNRLFTLNTSWYKVLKMPRLLE